MISVLKNPEAESSTAESVAPASGGDGSTTNQQTETAPIKPNKLIYRVLIWNDRVNK